MLSDVEERARYDAHHERQQQERWRLVKLGESSDSDLDVEQRLRLTVLRSALHEASSWSRINPACSTSNSRS